MLSSLFQRRPFRFVVCPCIDFSSRNIRMAEKILDVNRIDVGLYKMHGLRVAELVRRTRDSVPDNIAYLKERGQDADKINMFFCDMDARKRMREELSKIPGILVSSSIPNNLEINAEGADKGGALIRLAARLGIDREATMSFGDGENDLSMIRMAGIGVAMENGEESVKAAADYITKTNNEAGVAKAICHFTGIE